MLYRFRDAIRRYRERRWAERELKKLLRMVDQAQKDHPTREHFLLVPPQTYIRLMQHPLFTASQVIETSFWPEPRVVMRPTDTPDFLAEPEA